VNHGKAIVVTDLSSPFHCPLGNESGVEDLSIANAYSPYS